MKKTMYWKEIRQTMVGSKGRFCSILLLMLLGSFALVGLKSTVPDMDKTATAYFKTYQTADLLVMADYGLSQADQEELQAIKNAQVEFGYLTDVTPEGTTDSLRLFSFSKENQISQYQVVAGKLPENGNQVALSSLLAKTYKLGDKIKLSSKGESSLKVQDLTVVGFVNSSELLSKTNLGQSTAGAGRLTGFGLVLPTAFDSETYHIARIRYEELADLSPFGVSYGKALAKREQDLTNLLADNGQARLEQVKKPVQDKLNQAKSQLDKVRAELASQKASFEASKDLLPDSLRQTTQVQLEQAEQEMKTNEQELADQESKLQQLTKPSYRVYSRSSFPGGSGYETFKNSLSSIEMISNIFPVVLYLVAAMVSLTTMTRFVDEERLKSGILKALGYGNRYIIQKFVVYGLVSSLVGTVLGVFLGTFFLPNQIAKTIMGNLTLGQLQVFISWPDIGLALVFALVSSVLPAYLVARRDLSERPARLLQAKPPVKGAKILLERLPFIWRRLSFTYKVTARNIFRYKQRMLMTIFGVAGSVALLFAGLGIRSSVGSVVGKQFEDSLTYDMIVSQIKSASSQDQQAIKEMLEEKADKLTPFYYETSNQTIKGVNESQLVSLMVADQAELEQQVKLVDQSEQPLKLSDQGIIISEKLAQLYGVKARESFDFTDEEGKKVSLTVDKVTKLYAGHFIFMSKDYYERIWGQPVTDNAYWVKTKSGQQSDRDQLATDLLVMDGIASVVQNTDLIRTLDSVVASLNSVMLILVVVSVLLGMVILYNLTTINVAERLRELSTIKVLGFYNKEVTLYIYRETIILSLVGIGVGLWSGSLLHQFIIKSIGGSSIIFEEGVTASVYLIPIISISSIIVLLGLLVNRLLRRVDMLEALKSVD